MSNNLPIEKQTLIVSLLAECNSIRAIERVTGVHRDTIMRLGLAVGKSCIDLLDSKMRYLGCERMEIDEIWGFIGKKNKNATSQDRSAGLGDVWTFLSIDSDTKLMPNFVCGLRDVEHTRAFIRDLSSRLRNRIQLSSDAMGAYYWAVGTLMTGGVDYGQVVKEYAAPTKEENVRYSPSEVVSVTKIVKFGNPDPDLISTSYVERSNLTTRMHVKRLSRLTLAFSKKKENFEAAIGLYLAYYNFCLRHSTVGTTPAHAAGIADAPWTVADLLHAIA